MDYLCRLTFQKLIGKNLVGGASDENSLLHPTASAALKVVSRRLERLRSRALSGQTVTNSEQWIYQSSGATSPPLLQPSVCLFSTSDWVFSPLFIRIVRCNPPPAVQSLAQVFFECLFLRLDGVKPKGSLQNKFSVKVGNLAQPAVIFSEIFGKKVSNMP